MTEQKTIQILNDIRMEQGISFAELAVKVNFDLATVMRFFRFKIKGKKAYILWGILARAIGLNYSESEGCVTAIIAYYKNKNNYSTSEKELIQCMRKLCASEKRVVENLVQVMTEKH